MQEKKTKKIETVIVLEDSDFWSIVFKDLIEHESVMLLTPNKRWTTVPKGILTKLCRAHHSFRVNRKVNLPFKKIWDKYDYVYKSDRDVKRWIFTDTSIRNYDARVLLNLKRQGIRLYLLFLNPISSIYETEYALRLVRTIIFDAIYTVDTKDAEHYGFIYTSAVYSKIEVSVNAGKWDASFVGAAKNRLKMLHAFAKLLQNERSIFYITGVADKDRKALCNVVYNNPMSYESVLNIVNKSDCILEVVQDNQNGYTFRTYEAICYNKRLITNNPGIRKSEFYNPKYIMCFSELDKSVLDFIKNKTVPDYNYSGQYSPLKLYNEILAREKNELTK